MNLQRPDPDKLLAEVEAVEARKKQGSLKIFFGYAAGVGKTYGMLYNAQQAHEKGRDVVAGYVEPHGRRETEALLDGLEILPTHEVPYHGVTLREFNIDAALARHPELILVDELAHTNVEGSRHSKRWQDIEELLEAGINVWTTLNVQHIESLNDVIGQITGITVRETIPDHVFDLANDLELIDITPEELVDRLQAGKIYIPDQAQRAIQKFFQKPNLVALRELSLRQAARRIHHDVESARREQAPSQPWATNEKLLVCVGPSPTTSKVIRTAKRMATAFDATWLAVSVDQIGGRDTDSAQPQIAQHFRLAERLGAETITLVGQQMAETILEYARSRNVTKILIGKSAISPWKRFLYGSLVDDILDNSGDIDVYVIHGEKDHQSGTNAAASKSKTGWNDYIYASIIVTGTAIAATLFSKLTLTDTEANSVMLFLAAVACVAYQFGRGPSTWSSILAVLLFDFLFVPPYYTFSISDIRYIITFGVMLAIGLVISTLTSRLRTMIERTLLREQRTLAQYELGKQLTSLYGDVFLTSATGKKMAEMTGGEVAIYLAREGEELDLVYGKKGTIAGHFASTPAAQWVIKHDEMAGAGTHTLPNAIALFLPLRGSLKVLGAIAVKVSDIERLLQPDQHRLLESCANQLGLALERDQLAIDAADTRVQFEAEQIRSSLLSGVSHDLKTPLAVIAGASSTLIESKTINAETRQQLLQTVNAEATRLNRLLDNILQMSKLDAGASPSNKQWHVLEEIVGSALKRLQQDLQHHQVTTHLPHHLRLLYVDDLLIEQLLVNLLENAVHYTPADSQITISATEEGKFLKLMVTDNGPGLIPGSEEHIFEKFYRSSTTADATRGTGLGLAICRAIAKVHDGNITAANRPQGGAEFTIRLPLSMESPTVMLE